MNIKLSFLSFLHPVWIYPLQASSDAEIVDFLGSIGKIYSVIAVVCAIFIGIVIYLWRIDRKLTKLENQIDDDQKRI